MRALSLAKYLPENDIRVDVLTARNAPAVGKDLSLLQQVPSEVQIHRTWTLDLPFWARKSLKKAITGGKGKPSSASDGSAAKDGNPVRRWIGNLLLPDPQIGWLPFAFPAAVRIIRSRSIDAVLITVPPYSSVRLVGRLRKLFPQLPIVLDFRDEWLSTTIDLVSFNNNSRARRIARKTESEGVRNATSVVLVTEAARRELQARYPDVPAEKFVCINNGYDAPPPTARVLSSAPANAQKIVLTYIGTVYGSTAPGTFVEAVLGLAPEVRSRLHIRYIGHIEAPVYREQLLSLGDTIELKGFVPQAEALAAIRSTDYLLLITHDRINVAAKFYDYLGGGKPILAAVHPDGDVRRLLEETRSGRWADGSDPQAIRRMLEDAVHASGSLVQPDLERIAAYHRRPLTARYAALLKGLVGAEKEKA